MRRDEKQAPLKTPAGEAKVTTPVQKFKSVFQIKFPSFCLRVINTVFLYKFCIHVYFKTLSIICYCRFDVSFFLSIS